MIGRALSEALAVLAPPSCPGCGDALLADGAPLCPACVRALPWLPRRTCPRCALPSHRGRACPAAAAAFARAWSPLAYDGVARRLVGALKFRGALPVADVMAAHVAANLPPDLRDQLAIVPVAAQPWRRRRRGFDSADELAGALGRRLGAPVVRCLARRDRHGRQVGASRRQRRREDRLVVELTAAPPGRVLVVDDVHTTGATLDACARALADGGCAQVAAVTYARTL